MDCRADNSGLFSDLQAILRPIKNQLETVFIGAPSTCVDVDFTSMSCMHGSKCQQNIEGMRFDKLSNPKAMAVLASMRLLQLS